MRKILSCLVSFVLCLCVGCTSIRPQCSISSTGQITCGVDIPLDQAGATGTVQITSGGTKYLTREVDQCGNARSVTRVETCPCQNGRGITQTRDVVSVYGRAFSPVVGSRGLTSVSRATVHRDLKREAHNASVLRSYSNDRSMWSSFKGHVFGVHDQLCPLDYAPIVEVSSGPQVGEILDSTPLPSVDPGLPPSGIIPPPDTKSVSNLEMRVGAIETRQNVMETKLDGMEARIIAAITAAKPK